jgi:hypothetical protein
VVSIPLFGPKTRFWFYLPDKRTVVFDQEEKNIKTLIERKGKPTLPPAWAADWATIEGGVFGLVMTDPSTKYAAKIHFAPPDKNQLAKRFREAWTEILSKAEHVIVGGDIGKTCRLDLIVSSRTAEDGNAVFATCNEIITWAEEQRKAAAITGKGLLPDLLQLPKVELSIRCGVNFEPQFRHTTGVQIEFKGGIGDLVKGIVELEKDEK